MAITGDKLRLAVGIFYEPPRLSRAIAELFAEGVGAQDMCLVGMPSAFEAARHDEIVADGGQVAGVLAGFQLHNLGNLIDGCQLSASSGALLRTLLKHAKWSKGDQRVRTDWLWPELCARLTDHIRQGALVLIVGAPTLSSQHQCSRTLLRHSAHTVQTHEFVAFS
jgi:hypothetical protein